MTEEKFRLEAVVEQSSSRRRNRINNLDNSCPVMDHECRHFKSEREMCRYWGITSELTDTEENMGWTRRRH